MNLFSLCLPIRIIGLQVMGSSLDTATSIQVADSLWGLLGERRWGLIFMVFAGRSVTVSQLTYLRCFSSSEEEALISQVHCEFWELLSGWYVAKAPFCCEYIGGSVWISLGCLPAHDPAVTAVQTPFTQVTPVIFFCIFFGLPFSADEDTWLRGNNIESTSFFHPEILHGSQWLLPTPWDILTSEVCRLGCLLHM